jgi:hypothetical protein
VTRDIEMRQKAPAPRIECTVEQQRFDAVMVMELLDVPHMGQTEPDVRVQIRAQCADTSKPCAPATACSKPSGVAAAASHVDL